MRILLALLLLASVVPASAQSNLIVRSPDQRLEVQVRLADRVRYEVLLRGQPLLRDSSLSLDVEHHQLGAEPKLRKATQRTFDQMVEPVVRQKFAHIREHYNELRLEMEGGYVVVFRAFNEGVAYRFETALPDQQVHVFGEEAVFNFPGDAIAFYPQEESFFSHNERKYTPVALRDIKADAIASLPAVVAANHGVKIAIAESGVDDYPGLWLRGTAGNALAATFPPYPLKEKLGRDRDLRVVEAADYIAVTRGTRVFPWRVIAVAERDGDLITNSLVWLLAPPTDLKDTSWIKPGKVAWDWWNANNIYGVDFPAGINTQTYKYYIDFAAAHGLQYVILDEGWYKLGNLLEVVPEMDIPELTAYARQKNVGIILWVVWKTLDDQLQPALDQFARWGVQGIKVDFMQRNDQPVVNFYHKVCREAAKRKMLVDFHGGQVSATMTRTWPNLITNEGVRGMEWSKWSTDSEPEHNVTLAFTRMFLGPMDYTPGAMLNATKDTFQQVFRRPMAMGTRAHQLAMYVVYESPLQMLADSPSNYLREPETLEFLSVVPTVWDDTRVLDARIADYVLLARRHGNDWYVGAMNDWTARELEVDLSFLPPGNFRLDAYEDGPNAARMAGDYRRVRQTVTASSKLKIKLAPGGGWAARIYR